MKLSERLRQNIWDMEESQRTQRREAADLLDECEQIFAEFAKAGGSGYEFRSREMLAKLRAQERG